MITKMLENIRRMQNASEDEDHVKVYVTRNGGLRVKGHELAQNAAWRAKVQEMIDADLTGKNRQERDE